MVRQAVCSQRPIARPRDAERFQIVSKRHGNRLMETEVLLLLAEDEPLIGITLREDLEEAGYRIYHVSTGGEAIAVLESGDVKISGVITDIRLGSGPDGWSVARRAREIDPAIPIVYISGDSAHEHRACGVPDSAMVQKPFAPVQIISAISTLLNAVPPAQG